MSQDVKTIVREKYGEAALRVVAGEKGTCCGTSCGCGHSNGEAAFTDPITRDLYDSVTTASLPEEAVLASLGCGNPTALAELTEVADRARALQLGDVAALKTEARQFDWPSAPIRKKRYLTLDILTTRQVLAEADYDPDDLQDHLGLEESSDADT